MEHDDHTAAVPDDAAERTRFEPGRRAERRRRVIAVVAVFLCALCVRLLYAGPAIATLYGVGQERYRIAHFYHEAAASLAEGDDRVVFPRNQRPENTLLVGYPPGYFAVMAGVYSVTNNSMAAVLVVQCLLDALACALLVLLGEALVSTLAGTVAGLLMAIAPQFAYLSLVLKPDTLMVLPVLMALLLVLRAMRSKSTWPWVLAGITLGLACWLRQNALLLAPALAFAVLAVGGWRRQLRGVVLMLLVCAATVAPLTVRNIVIFGEPIPVTIGSGFALLSGLARDDFEGRYGLSRFAYNVSVDEALERGLPEDYYFDEFDRLQADHRRKFEVKHTVTSVFAVDGIARDRDRRRVARGLILSDVGYFARIYAGRVGRLLGYTAQNRPVPAELRPPGSAYRSLAFYAAVDPRFGALRYYWNEGHVWDLVRPPLAALQRLFVTPVLLVLAALGFAICVRRSWRLGLLLLVVPVYYIGLQSLMWSEFRHTLPVHASVFICIGALVATVADRAVELVRSRRRESLG